MPDSNGRGGILVPLRRRHVSELIARGFYRSALKPEEKIFVLRHLLSRCARCSELMLRIGTAEGFLAPAEREVRSLITEDPEIGTRRLQGVAQWAILQGLAEDRIAFVEKRPEFHHLGFYERLIDVAKLEPRRDPPKAMEAARIAIAVAGRLNLPADLQHDYLATGYAVLGNTLRLGADFAGAERAFDTAWDLVEDGTADPLVDGLIYRYEGALFDELGRYDEAEAAYRNALIEYASIGDEHLQGRTLLSMANSATSYDPAKALAILDRANGLFQPLIEPFLEWCSRHIQIWCLNDLGEVPAALELLEASRDLYNHFGRADLLVHLRLHWVEARIAFNLGQLKEAEGIFSMLFRQLDEEGKHPVDLTLVAVDLLHTISAQEGREDDLFAFSEHLLPLLRNLGLHEQGLAVLLLLRERLLQGAFRREVRWKVLETYFRRNWHSPLPEAPTLG
jgi:tetratricopeptide (TPR) repeat protein